MALDTRQSGEALDRGPRPPRRVTHRAPAAHASALAELLRLRPYEWPALIAAIVIPLNSNGPFAGLVSPGLKAAAGAMAMLSVVARGISPSTGSRARGFADAQSAPTRLLHRMLVIYAALMVVLTLASDVPGQRKLLALQFALCLCLFFGLDRLRPGSFFGVVFWASGFHLLLAGSTGAAEPWLQDEQRLTGGTHPILLGFEAAMLLLVATWGLRDTRTSSRLFFAAAAAGAVWVLFGAFSRAALISAGLALVVMWTFRSRWWGVKLGFVAAGAVFVISTRLDQLLVYLSQDQIQSLYSGTGRIEIWQHIWAVKEQFWIHGFGFGALNDGLGPDWSIWGATGGENAENTPLQVLLDGGILLVACWVAIAVLSGVVLVNELRPRSFGVGVVIVLLVSATTSQGLSGEGFQWWWLLGLLSLAAGSSAYALPHSRGRW